eukprot:7391912-Prymnesium_polylepis.3
MTSFALAVLSWWISMYVAPNSGSHSIVSYAMDAHSLERPTLPHAIWTPSRRADAAGVPILEKASFTGLMCALRYMGAAHEGEHEVRRFERGVGTQVGAGAWTARQDGAWTGRRRRGGQHDRRGRRQAAQRGAARPTAGGAGRRRTLGAVDLLARLRGAQVHLAPDVLRHAAQPPRLECRRLLDEAGEEPLDPLGAARPELLGGQVDGDAEVVLGRVSLQVITAALHAALDLVQVRQKVGEPLIGPRHAEHVGVEVLPRSADQLLVLQRELVEDVDDVLLRARPGFRPALRADRHRR